MIYMFEKVTYRYQLGVLDPPRLGVIVFVPNSRILQLVNSAELENAAPTIKCRRINYAEMIARIKYLETLETYLAYLPGELLISNDSSATLKSTRISTPYLQLARIYHGAHLHRDELSSQIERIKSVQWSQCNAGRPAEPSAAE